MKNFYYYLTLLLIICNLSIINGQELKVVKIDFYYLPWRLTTQYNLSEANVRDFNNGRNSIYTIEDEVVIGKFTESLSVFYLNILDKHSVIDTRMVIDFYFENGQIKTLLLSNNQFLLYNNNLYLKNHSLNKLLEEYLPPAIY